MATTRLHLIAATLVIAGFVTALVRQNAQNQRLRTELHELREQVATTTSPVTPVPAPPAPAGPSEELLLLRGEVTRLRALQPELIRLRTENERLQKLSPAAASRPRPLTGEEFLAANAERDGVKQTASGLQYAVLSSGTGKTPKPSDTVKVHYHGTLIDGTVFDSSVDRGQPINLPVGAVIPGWSEALQLMKEGDKWQLFVPAKLAYGEKGAGAKIGPNSTLLFEVELLEIEPPKEP